MFILTETDSLTNKKTGISYPIVPGMVASVDIKSGEKTVYDYLMKPFGRISEAMRER